MKIIKANAIQSITASSSNAAYPAANLTNESPKKKWAAADATVTHATITANVYHKSGGLGMVGIVAESATVTISDPNGIVWQNVEWQNVDWQVAADAVTVTTEWVDTGDGYKTLWVSFPQFDSAVQVTIELFKSPENPAVLSAGVLVIGEVLDIPFVRYPLGEGMFDYSILRELSNGATYYKRRDIVRTFSLSLLVNRAEYFYKFMREMARVIGLRPFMVLLSDWSTDFVVYGRFQGLPSGSHSYFHYSEINFSLIEVL